MAEEPEVEQMHASPPAARIVRPYALTAGRTRTSVDLPLEATLRLDTSATRRPWGEDVQGKIIGICDLRSVAEVSALVQRPIGVVRSGEIRRCREGGPIGWPIQSAHAPPVSRRYPWPDCLWSRTTRMFVT
jgi:hypothetical protein